MLSSCVDIIPLRSDDTENGVYFTPMLNLNFKLRNQLSTVLGNSRHTLPSFLEKREHNASRPPIKERNLPGWLNSGQSAEVHDLRASLAKGCCIRLGSAEASCKKRMMN